MSTHATDDAATIALRGPLLTFRGDPFLSGLESTLDYDSDAIVAMRGGRITYAGPAAAVARTLPASVQVERNGTGTLMLAGFIDCHVHYAQAGIVASFGRQLIEWLEQYTFVAEQAFVDASHARSAAAFYVGEALRQGVTTAANFCTVHPQSVDALFEAAQALDMRMIAGKVMMDRHAPAALTDTAQQGYDESKALIERWHGRGRLVYAITPRFAATSTPGQLLAAAALRREHADCLLQSHIAENRAEVAWIAELFPEADGYLDVYERHGLIGPRSIYGHGVWLTEQELARCHATGTAIAHCPTSNAFLGSGTFDLMRARRAERPVSVGLATDVGGGTTFSMLRTMGAAYSAAQAHGNALSAGHAFYLATRGSAQALHLEDRIGSIVPGMEADLVVLDLHSTPLIDYRMRRVESLEEALFVQMTLGDERAVKATYVAGVRRF